MIICVEDDKNIRELEIYTLESVGMTAKGVENGYALFEVLDNYCPELIVLDIMLPDMDGGEILKRLKASYKYRNIPVIMATAKGSEYDKVSLLELGADDYLVKPFGMLEMVARVKAVLRRCAGAAPVKKSLSHKRLELRVEEHLVLVEGKEISLTYKEFELLRFLLENSGIVFTRDKLLTEIWGYDFAGETRTVDVHIRTLRQKLGQAGDIIETVRGLGYKAVKEHEA